MKNPLKRSPQWAYGEGFMRKTKQVGWSINLTKLPVYKSDIIRYPQFRVSPPYNSVYSRLYKATQIYIKTKMLFMKNHSQLHPLEGAVMFSYIISLLTKQMWPSMMVEF